MLVIYIKKPLLACFPFISLTHLINHPTGKWESGETCVHLRIKVQNIRIYYAACTFFHMNYFDVYPFFFFKIFLLLFLQCKIFRS